MQVEVRARSQAHVSHISRGGINAVVVNKVKRHFKGKLKLCCGMWIIIREANNSKRVCSQQGPTHSELPLELTCCFFLGFRHTFTTCLPVLD